MIQFKCICGEPFEVPAELAGDQFQCPTCNRLVDVPLLGDADSFDEDGTIKIEDAKPIPSALASKIRAFAYRDDLRQTVEEYLAMDDAPPPEEPPKLPPKYDPETGELIEQIDVNTPDYQPVQSIPMAKPTLAYARKDVEGKEFDLKWWQLPYHLLTGASLASLIILFIVHAFWQILLIVPGFNVLMSVFVMMMFFAIIAHYCNVVEEFGPRDNDSVPVMLRNASFSEDVWLPLVAYFASFFYSFSPMFACMILRKMGIPMPGMVLTAMFFLGICVFPGVLLTAITSGTVNNMLPHRVLSVFMTSPVRYVIATILMVAGYYLYILMVTFVPFFSISMLATPATSPTGIDYLGFLKQTSIFYGITALAIYVMHLAAAMLGMIYRDYHDQFNWVLQEHQKRIRPDTIAQLEHMRRTGDPRLRRHKKVTPVQPKSPPA